MNIKNLIKQDIEETKKIIENGLNIDEIYLSELIQEILNSKQDINIDYFKFLIDIGVDINKEDINGERPLSIALDCFEVFKLLINNNADLNFTYLEQPFIYFLSFFLDDDFLRKYDTNNIIEKEFIEKTIIQGFNSGIDVNLMVNDKISVLEQLIGLGNINAVKLFLQNGADIKKLKNELILPFKSEFFFQLENLNDIIITSIRKNKLDIFKLLIDFGVDIKETLLNCLAFYYINTEKTLENNNEKDKLKITLLLNNMFDDNFNTLKFLFDSSPNYKFLKILSDKILGFLILIIKNKDYKILKFLVDKIEDINLIERVILFEISKNNDIKALEILLDAGLNKDNLNKILLYAVDFNKVEIAIYCLDNGGNPNYKEDGFPLYQIAKKYDDQIIADKLELMGADTNIPVSLEEKSEEMIDFKNNFEEERLNLKKERQENISNLLKYFDGLPLLKSAIETKSMKKLQKLLDLKINLKNIDVTYLFRENYPLDFIYEVVKQTSILDYQDKDGMTPLMYSVQSNHYDMVKYLLDRNVDKNLKNNDSKRAKDLTNDVEMRKLLISHEPKKHNPEKLVKILSRFSKEEPLKFTTHSWDTNKFDDFNDFINDVKQKFKEIEFDLKDMSPNLFRKINIFLFEKNISNNTLWSKNPKVNYGWSNLDGLSEFCNSGGKPSNFILPENIKILSGHKTKLLKYFGDVIDLFKQEIEIREDFGNLQNIFAKAQEFWDEKGLNILLSLSDFDKQFYTDVEIFSNVLNDRVFETMSKRINYPDIRVSCKNDGDIIEIKIVQINSFSNKSPEELLKEVNDGDFAEIKASLTNLCDWSIENSFNNKYYRINYLHSTDIDIIQGNINEHPEGFTYIFRFYK